MANKLGWSHDGITFKVASDDVVVLQTPLATLGVAPDVLMGQDPATGLPAFCTGAGLTTGSKSTPPLSGGACDTLRCGAALQVTQYLESLYNTFKGWINAGIGAVGAASTDILLGWLSAFLEAAVLAETVAGWWVVAFTKVRPLLDLIGGGLMGGVLPPWDTTTVNNVQRTFFCALQCDATPAVSVSAGDMTNVAGFMRSNTADFLGNIVAELLAACCDFAPLWYWQTAVASGAPSAACAGYTCA